ncbi:MAG TPA: alpha/beta hydrolase [Candidatus Angelobacter sp.]|jgi:pimeloyl-ACP methyl ester carboxylesterase|nr:alpha/beta hydrolase [Candidatus Angelobacter sp.]
MPASRTVRRALGAAGALALSAAAWEVQRRRDARSIAADPDTVELSRPIRGDGVEVRSADGTVLHAEVFGPADAPTVVLVHGWTNEIAVWHHQIRDLMGEFRVVAYDQRGHGRSEPPRGGDYSSDALGDDLHAVIEATVPDTQRCVVVGHSMGGMTIVAWAGRHPQQVAERCAGAMLVGTGMGDLLEQLLVLRPRIGARVYRALAPRALDLPLKLPQHSTPLSYRAIRYVALSPNASPGAVAFTEEITARCPAPVRAGFGRALSSLDLYESVPELRVPTVVMVGALDKLTPPWHARKLAQTLPDVAELVELPGAGHMLQLEAPGEVTSRIAELARSYLAAPRAAAVS